MQVVGLADGMICQDLVLGTRCYGNRTNQKGNPFLWSPSRATFQS
jgi:hypothetical protein